MIGFTEMLDVAIGLFFVFALLSLLATWVQEFIATSLKLRSKDLANTLQRLLDPSKEKTDAVRKLQEKWDEGVNKNTSQKLRKNVLKAFYEHPVIGGLSEADGRPSYISSRQFGTAMIDLLVKAGAEDRPAEARAALDSLKNGIQMLGNDSTRDALLVMVRAVESSEKQADKQLAALRQNVEQWFDATMERATGWYKRKAQKLALAVGMALALAFNANTLQLSRSLWQDSSLRSTVAASAVAYIEKGDDVKAGQAKAELESMGLPLGWSQRNLPGSLGDGIWWLVGLLLTGFAISQGSPFWFDLLGRVINIRGTGKKPQPVAAAAAEGAAAPSTAA